jgi:predicted DNA-binding protein YlxM (UPF0122 family)
MSALLEKIYEINGLVLQGKALEAFEKYYHDDVIMQENENAPTVGKQANLDVKGISIHLSLSLEVQNL